MIDELFGALFLSRKAKRPCELKIQSKNHADKIELQVRRLKGNMDFKARWVKTAWKLSKVQKIIQKKGMYKKKSSKKNCLKNAKKITKKCLEYCQKIVKHHLFFWILEQLCSELKNVPNH